MSEADIDRSARYARNISIALFGGLCLLDIGLVAMAKDAWAIARICFAIALMYWALQGYKWAKWLLVGHSSLLIVALIAVLLALGSELTTPLVVGSWVMVALSALFVFYLVTNQDLNRYFALKRQAIQHR